MKALVVYGTRKGATKQIAEEIGKVLGGQGYDVTVRDAKDMRGIDANIFDLIIVGSSVFAGMWKWQASRFLKKNEKKLSTKKVALFSSGLLGDDPANQKNMEEAGKVNAKVVAKVPAIRPLALAYFGGCMTFTGGNFVTQFMANMLKKDYEKRGIDTSKPIDHRDWDAIRKWAADVGAKAKSA